MDWADLQHFFLMHGENRDRKQGTPGRGRFGTGKSAAFGIADVLRVRTVRNNIRTLVQLSRTSVAAITSGEAIPVQILERDARCSEPNGTLIEIEKVHLRSLDQTGIIRFIERHLSRWQKGARVYINNHECEFAEPAVAFSKPFMPGGELRSVLGDVELLVKVAKAPIDEDLRGISIYSRGVWLETTLAGSEGREMAQYIFGEIDVPSLDDDSQALPAYDVSRSMRLNPSQDTVRAVYAFINRSVEEIRRDLVEREKERKAGEDARRLAKEAEDIAKFINEDFLDFRSRVSRVRARTFGGVDDRDKDEAGTDSDGIASGSDMPATILDETGGLGHGKGGKGGGAVTRNAAPILAPGNEGDEPIGGRAEKSAGSSRTGGFRVEYRSLGEESHRALYAREERSIYINLDHPQLRALPADTAVGEDLRRRISYEIAFCEYAIALAQELASRDEYLDPTDPIVDIRETLNRIARRASIPAQPSPRNKVHGGAF